MDNFIRTTTMELVNMSGLTMIVTGASTKIANFRVSEHTNLQIKESIKVSSRITSQTGTELKQNLMEVRIMDSTKMVAKRDMETLSFLSILSMTGNLRVAKFTV